MITIDLMLGSDIGLWTLDNIDKSLVKNVITKSVAIAHHSQKRGFRTYLANVNFFNYDKAEIGYSVHYPVIIKDYIINSYKKIYNLHPSLLPYGKGFFPVFWAIWEKTKAGATIHEITEKVDEGPLVLQKEVQVYDFDTGGSLHSRVTEAEKKIFAEHVKSLKEDRILPAIKQTNEGSYHTMKEFFNLKRNANLGNLKFEEFLRLVRAFSFEGYSGLEIEISGKKYEIKATPVDKKI